MAVLLIFYKESNQEGEGDSFIEVEEPEYPLLKATDEFGTVVHFKEYKEEYLERPGYFSLCVLNVKEALKKPVAT